MFWICRTFWSSLADTIHLLADSTQSSCIRVSWSSSLSGIDGALLDWFLNTVSSLFGNPAINLLNLVLLKSKLGQVLPETICIHLLKFLGMSSHSCRILWLIGSRMLCLVSHSSLLHHTGVIQPGMETGFFRLDTQVWRTSNVTVLASLTNSACILHKCLIFRGSVGTSSELHDTWARKHLWWTNEGSLRVSSCRKVVLVGHATFLLIYFIFSDRGSTHLWRTINVCHTIVIISSSDVARTTIKRVGWTWAIQKEWTGSSSPGVLSLAHRICGPSLHWLGLTVCLGVSHSAWDWGSGSILGDGLWNVLLSVTWFHV